MTEKLYYSDSYIFEFTGEILSVESVDNKTAVVLNKTAFFPEGGGQSADTGYIGDAFVSDVREINGTIYHIVSSGTVPETGSVVNCRINAEKRFIRMQSHTGEHIVSGIAHSLYGAENVGFHMNDTLMTVDLDIPLTKEQLQNIEEKANEVVYKNLSVKTYIVSAEDAIAFNYRSKLEFSDDVRLVDIEDTDLCACCAPHVKHTGEIGVIKILTSVSHRGGVRLTLVCGKTAFEDYVMKHNSTLSIAAMLCSRHNETDSAVAKLADNNTSLKYEFTLHQKILLGIIAEKIMPDKIITEFYDNLSMEDLREICNGAKDKCKFLCIILSGNDTGGYSYCIYSESNELQNIVKHFNTTCNGSGGGRGNMLQGKVKSTKETITNFFTELKV